MTISLDPSLLNVPWELLDAGRGPLSLTWAIGRSLQGAADSAARAPEPRPIERALIVADPDGALDESYAEGVALHAAFKARRGVASTLRAADVDADFVRCHARGCDLLHYAGHVDEEGWRMSCSTLRASDITRLAGGGRAPSVVFINGCAAGARAGEGTAMLEAWFAAGVCHVVGPLYDLPDRLGREAARRFYDALMGGAPIGEALRQTRVSLAREIGEGTTPWGAYALYGDPRTVYAASAGRVAAPRRATRLAPPTSTPGSEKIRRAEAAPAAVAGARGGTHGQTRWSLPECSCSSSRSRRRRSGGCRTERRRASRTSRSLRRPEPRQRPQNAGMGRGAL